jgi:hypothetical protein
MSFVTPPPLRPALLTSTRTPPGRLATDATIACTCAGCVTSQRMPVTFPAGQPEFRDGTIELAGIASD